MVCDQKMENTINVLFCAVHGQFVRASRKVLGRFRVGLGIVLRSFKGFRSVFFVCLSL